MNHQDLDASLRAVKAAEQALFTEGWAPRKVIILADVIDANGDQLFLGTGTSGVSEKEVLGLLVRALAGMAGIKTY
jgi:hypothetical protein